MGKRPGRYRPVLGTGELTLGSIATITDDSYANALPNLCRLSNGHLLVVYDKRLSGPNSDRVVGKTSSDDGATWSSEFTIAPPSGGYYSANPGVIVLASGRILVTYNNATDSTPSIPDGTKATYSDDNGLTWSSPYTVDSSFTAGSAPGTSRPVQLADGTVVISEYGSHTGDTYATSHAFFSIDNGATFGGQVTIANGQSDGRNYFEPAMALLDSGVILCHLRTSDETGGWIYQNYSLDKGQHWSPPVPIFLGHSVTNVYQRPATRTLVAVVRDNSSQKTRAYTSVDRGDTWSDQGILDSSGTWMFYGCPIDRLNGSLLVAYAVEPASDINNIDLKQIVLTEALA